MQIWSEQGFAAIDFGNRSAAVVSPSEAILRREFDFESLDPADEKATFKDRLFSDVLRRRAAGESSHATPWPTSCAILSTRFDCIASRASPGNKGRDALAVADAILESIAEHSWQRRPPPDRSGPLARPSQHAACADRTGTPWHRLAPAA